MRTIKFRGKILELNLGCKMNVGDWVYGDLHLLSKIPHIHTDNGKKYPIDINTIGQYTGLKDKNGVEIYEGDIFRGYYNEIFEIVYNEEDGSFLARESCNLEKYLQFYGKLKDLEVIGNIHDNPELLKGE